MRRCAFIFAAVLTLSLPLHAEAYDFPSPISRIFVPEAFDVSDSVEVILQGEYPNSCYRPGATGASVDEVSKTIVVWATSYLAPDYFCQQTFVPFVQVVKIGMLQGGRYTIAYLNNSDVAAPLEVGEISSFFL